MAHRGPGREPEWLEQRASGDVGARSCSRQEWDRVSSPWSLRSRYCWPYVDGLAAVVTRVRMTVFTSPNEAASVAMETRAASISARCRVRRADVPGRAAATAAFPCAARSASCCSRDSQETVPQRPRRPGGPAGLGS